MNLNTGKLFLVLTLLLSLSLSVSAASAQTVVIADGSADSGTTTTVAITANDVTDLANFDITITYDPTVVNVTSAANDAAFGSSMNNLESASTGTVRLLSFNLDAGQTGNVLLSTLTLKAVGTATQTSALTITINELTNSAGSTITATPDDGVFTVSGAVTGPVVVIADGSADSGATTTVAITANDVTDLANFDITIIYDPAVVNVTSAANDDAFGSSMNNLESASTGTVRLLSFNLDAGQTGNVLLSTLTLKAVGTATKTSALAITINELTNSAGSTITATPDDGVFTVSDAPAQVTLDSIAVTGDASVVNGSTGNYYVATATYSNGTSEEITAVWNSSNETVATIDEATGELTALAEGTTTVTATSGGVSGTIDVTVTPTPTPVLTTITVTPTTATVTVGGTQTFAATTLDQFGDSITATVTWVSSNEAVATIDASTGVLTALAAGTTTVTATSNGVVSNAVSVTVTETPVLTTITVTPATNTLEINDTQTFTATTLDQFGDSITATVAWTSSNATVATIDASTGVLTALAAGTTTVTATSGSVSGTAAVTVIITPVLPSLPTSYWGNVTENGTLMADTVVTVRDASGNELATNTSTSGGLYLIIVPWDDLTTTSVDEGVVSGETITFIVSGKTVATREIDEQGTNNKLDLAVTMGAGVAGDINDDGSVTSVDALMVLQMTVGNLAETASADINSDGNVTSVDALMILQAVVGNIVL